MPIGGILKNESAIVQSVSNDYYKKRGILQQMLQNISDAMDNRGVEPRGYIIVCGQAWQDLLRTLRYWGGAASSVNVPLDASDLPNGSFQEFILDNRTVSPEGNKGVYDLKEYLNFPPPDDVSFTSRKLVHFMPRALQNITEIGRAQPGSQNDDYNTLVGMRILREFIHERFPVLEQIFANIATAPIMQIGATSLIDENVDFGNQKPAGLTDSGGAATVKDVLGGYFNEVTTIAELGIPEGVLPGATPDDQFDALEAAIKSVYDPFADAVNFALPVRITEANVRNSLHMKTSFSVCPHISFKFGYFFNEVNTCFYAKIGGILLDARVMPAANLYGVKEEPFRKITPFLAIGMTKNISDHWSVSLELSHAFRSKKRLQDINALGHRLRNDITVSKSDIRILFVYKI
jgi:hypothetical protein